MRLSYFLVAVIVTPSVHAYARPLDATPALAIVQQGVPLSGGDIERLNPARVIADLRENLGLDERQLDVLDSLRKAFEDAGKPLADDVKRHQRAITSPPPLLRRPRAGKPETRKDSVKRAKLDSTNRMKRDEYFSKVTAGRRDLAATLLALKELFDTHAAQAAGLLTTEQRTGAELALERASADFTRRLRLANIR